VSEPDARPFRRGDVVELRGIVLEVDHIGGQVRVALGRGVAPAWVPVRRLQLVAAAEDWTNH